MEVIYEQGGVLDVVLTLADERGARKSGRVYVDDFCATHQIDLVKIRSVNDADAVAAVKARRLDWLFIIGWSQIARTAMLEAPARGVIGMHPTLLPEGRGRAAIPWAILKGLPKTGVTMFKLDEGVDTGPVIAQETIPLASDETATTLYDKVGLAHRSLMRDAWGPLVADRVVLTPQDSSRATEWPGRTPDDGVILPAMTVAHAERLVRATTHPYPGAFWKGDGQVLRIWRGEIGDAGTTPAPGARRIHLADGVLDAREYDVEG